MDSYSCSISTIPKKRRVSIDYSERVGSRNLQTQIKKSKQPSQSQVNKIYYAENKLDSKDIWHAYGHPSS